MTLDDSFVEIISEGFDVAIRVDNPPDNINRAKLRARKLSETPMRFVASEQYLAVNGTPVSIDDLANHHLLHYSNHSTGNVWNIMAHSGEIRQVRATGRLTVNNGAALMNAAIADLGIARLPCFIIDEAIQKGQVVRILDSLPELRLEINAAYPVSAFAQPLLRIFIDYLVENYDA